MAPRRSRSRSAKETPFKAGRVTRNPFLNFLRDFRRNNPKRLPLTELTKLAGEVWRKMNQREKSPYYGQAREAPAKSHRRRRSRRRRRRSRSRRRRSRGGRRRRERYSSDEDDDGGRDGSSTSSSPKIVELPPDDDAEMRTDKPMQ